MGLGPALAEAASQRCLPQLCDALDGVFAAAVYDPGGARLHLCTDRLGVQPLYLWHGGDSLAWASELKAFLPLPGFSRDVQPDALNAMMRLGHMVGDLTWFAEVQAVGAATVVSFDLVTGREVSRRRYWSWSHIPPLDLHFDDAVEALRSELVTSVRARVGGGAVGLSLSGGLDSRAILAALGSDARGLPTFTLGHKDSRDLRYARQVARRARTSHSECVLTARNWFAGRARAVWNTDGLVNVRHCHYTPFHAELSSSHGINLNGFLGGAVLGTSYLAGRPHDTRVNAELATELYGELARHDDPDDAFYATPHIEPYLINNRGRRFIALGSVEIAAAVEHRYPLISRRLLEIAFGLPDRFREAGLYHAALLSLSPDLVGGIAWEKTGRSIRGRRHFRDRAREWLSSRSSRASSTSALADYDQWVRTEPFLSATRALLNSSGSLLREAVGHDYSRHVEVHLEGSRRYTEHIMRAFTAEIWLRLLQGVPLPPELEGDISDSSCRQLRL